MKIDECLTTRSEITQLEILDNNKAAVATKIHGIKIFSFDECEVQKNLSSKTLNSSTTAITFSPNGEMLAYANSDTIYVIYVPTHQVIKTIQVPDEEIEILKFDPNSKYIIAGTKNGRVLQYKYDNSSVLSRLCSFPYQKDNQRTKIRKNFVSSFAFYKNKVACSGYDGAIFIIDLLSRANQNVISHTRVRINALCFLDEDTIISGNIDGVIQVISLKDKRVYRRINAPFTKISQILIMPNPNYIMVSSNANYLVIIDIKNFKVVDSKYLEFEDKISKIALSKDETLLVGLENFKLLQIKLPSIAKLKSLIDKNLLAQAFKLLASEPMIRNSHEHIKLQEKYQEYFNRAVNALINNNADAATAFLKIFENTPSKKEEIMMLFKGFQEYPRFKNLILEYKYSIAYAMSSKYPALKHTPQYKKMEKIWKDIFSDAQRQMVLNRDDLAKEILAPYMTTAVKRPLIKFILNHNKKFLEFLKAIESREFETMEKLAKENEVFTQIPTYTALHSEIKDNVKRVTEYIKVGNIDLAKVYLEKIEESPYLQTTSLKLHKECENVRKLQIHYNNNELLSSYETLDTYKHLHETDLGVFLEESWSKLIITSEEYALKGDIKGLKNTLGHLIKLRSRSDKIGELLRVSFHTKLTQLISDKNYEKAKDITLTYLDTFGLDTEINYILKLFAESSTLEIDITQQHQKARKRDSWIKSNYFKKLT